MASTEEIDILRAEALESLRVEITGMWDTIEEEIRLAQKLEKQFDSLLQKMTARIGLNGIRITSHDNSNSPQ